LERRLRARAGGPDRTIVAAACFLAVLLLAHLTQPTSADTEEGGDRFVFYVASDMQGYVGPDYSTCESFTGVVHAIDRLGRGAFLVSPGDTAPVAATYWTITSTLGADYPWFPLMGNHETPSDEETTPGENLAWLQEHELDQDGPGVGADLIRRGPEGCPATTYSFDRGKVHFVALNVYCDAGGPAVTDGDIPDHLYAWLEEDLKANELPVTLVFGHEPAYPLPDSETNRTRHARDSLNTSPDRRDRFWHLLRTYGVSAYFAGHIHAYSAPRIDGVWQVTTAHARGIQDAVGRSTFVRVIVDGTDIWYETYRQLGSDPCAYELTDAWANTSTNRDTAPPTPQPSPTPPPRGIVGRLTGGRTARGVALTVASLALLATVSITVAAAAHNTQRSNRNTEEESR